MEYYLKNEKEWCIDTHNNMDETQSNYTQK